MLGTGKRLPENHRSSSAGGCPDIRWNTSGIPERELKKSGSLLFVKLCRFVLFAGHLIGRKSVPIRNAIFSLGTKYVILSRDFARWQVKAALYLKWMRSFYPTPMNRWIDFLPPFVPRLCLDTARPCAFNQMSHPEVYIKMRRSIQEGMEEALGRFPEMEDEFEEIFGCSYGVVEPIACENAGIILVTSGTITSASLQFVKEQRSRGKKRAFSR